MTGMQPLYVEWSLSRQIKIEGPRTKRRWVWQLCTFSVGGLGIETEH